ncbi:CD1107 family mobile element protein [Fusicatenibacter saccharivorans]|uniref:CD1107 family mobile element protein n=1 Tax=Lachnospiraceae TaxID=186803 RepID=UPI003F8B35E9
MKKIHKKAAALLFAVTVAGVPLGTAFLGSTVGANVFAQATEMAAEEAAEQEHTEIFPEEGQGEEQTAVAQPEEEQAGEQTAVIQSEDLPDEQTAGEVQADTAAEDTAVESENAVPETETQETAVQPDVVITITEPDGWQKEQAKAMIQVEDAAGSGNFSVAKVEARISENGSWLDVTQEREVTVTGNCSVYVRVTDQNGQTYTQSRYIECFDQTKPTLSAAAKNGVLIIRGTDEGSGVAAIYVNGNEFTELTDNTLKVRLQRADTSYQYFTLQVRDNAGNLSETYQVANPYYENPDAVSNPSDGTGTEENSNSLPVDASPTAPTSATATVTDYQSTVSDTSSGETETTETSDTEIAISDTDTGRIQGDIISSTVKGGKEFYTIRTKSGKIFYLIVDMDKTDDNVYLLTEVSENDLLNFTDTDTVTLPQNQAVMESSLPLEIVEQEPETEPEEKEPEEEAKPAEKTANNSGTILLMVLALVGVGGGYYYLKFVRGKKESFEYDDEDEDEGETAYEEDDTETEPEEDTGEEEPENEDSLEDEDYM